MGALGMDERHPSAVRPGTGGLVQEGNACLSELAHRFVQVRHLEADVVNALAPLLQKLFEGVPSLDPLDEFDLGPPDGKEGDLCPLCLDHLGPLTVKAEDLLKEPGRLVHAPHGHGNVRYALNHRSWFS